MDRNSFIQKLSEGVAPVQAVSSVKHQLTFWILLGSLSAVLTAYIASFMYPGFGWAAARYSNPVFWAEQVLLLLAALSSAWSAILLSRPGRDQKFTKLVSLGTLSLWAVLGLTYFDSFMVSEFSVMPVMAGYKCLVVSAISALPAAFLLSQALKKGFILNKPQTLFFMFLAITSLGSFALQFFCPNVDGLIKLVWHVLPIYAISSIFYLLSARRA